jgi:GNAT superfamily N-acetyltransferase
MTAIHEAAPRDAPEIAALLAELGYPTEPPVVERRLSALTDADAVLLADGGLVALHRIPRIADGGTLARVTALVVAADRRGQGLATALVAAAEDRAREWGCDLLEVSCGRRPERGPAHAFYRAAGFSDTSDRSVRYWKRLGGTNGGH